MFEYFVTGHIIEFKGEDVVLILLLQKSIVRVIIIKNSEILIYLESTAVRWIIALFKII